MFPFLAPTSISLTCLSFGRRRSLLLILFLAPFVFALSRISLVTFLMSFFSVLSVLFVFIFLGLLPSLLVLALCLSPLDLPRALCPRMLLASFFGTSSLVLTPLHLLPLLMVCLLLPLLPRLLLFGHTVFVGLLLLGPFLTNAPLSSILAAATWSSSSVFTSFYLRDVQFSSSHGFGLGPVVAAGNVI